MFMKKEAFFLEMWSYWTGGFGIGNIAGVALARFNQTHKPATGTPALSFPSMDENADAGGWGPGAAL